MIQKLVRLQNVGRFRACNPRGDVQFRRLTLIYAENGRGKTTLCDILRSLQSGDPAPIQGRETLGLGAGEKPEVRIRLDGSRAEFKDGKWTETLQSLCIYDRTFVFENIHSGEFVDHRQKRNLHGVILGAEGVSLQREIDSLDSNSVILGPTSSLRLSSANLATDSPNASA